MQQPVRLLLSFRFVSQTSFPLHIVSSPQTSFIEVQDPACIPLCADKGLSPHDQNQGPGCSQLYLWQLISLFAPSSLLKTQLMKAFLAWRWFYKSYYTWAIHPLCKVQEPCCDDGLQTPHVFPFQDLPHPGYHILWLHHVLFLPWEEMVPEEMG